jgi:hypothetical protein
MQRVVRAAPVGRERGNGDYQQQFHVSTTVPWLTVVRIAKL